jgi:hypothetical protein
MTRIRARSDEPETGSGHDAGPSAPSVGHNSTMLVEHIDTALLKLDEGNARVFGKRDEDAAVKVLRRFPVRQPLVVDADNVVQIGALILIAARRLKLETLPVVRVADLSAVEMKALSVAYGQLGDLGEWDRQRLGALMLKFELEIPGFVLEDLGFEVGAIDVAIDDANKPEAEPDALTGPPVSKLGDLWLLGKHRLLCGDACDSAVLLRLTAGKLAQMVFADPPFGCVINGFVAGDGRHREFVMGSGEMSDPELVVFFAAFMTTMLPHLDRGALVHLVIDWRSLPLLLDAARPIFGKLVNLAVWAKDRAGMGSYLRSQHELILIFKTPGKMRNNVELGVHGRNRSNVWMYPSARTFGPASEEGDLLQHHPTPKPVKLVADAILDCTRRGDIVFDAFLGSGTTLIAAERVGRTCYALDLDPLYVDLAVRRWQAWTGLTAVHAETGLSFDAMAAAAEAALLTA